MPEKKPIERARQDEREGKAPSTQAGEFVREEIELIREGAHGARSTKQAIAIGLSKARRAGVKLPPPKKGTIPEETREKAKRDLEKAQEGGAKPTSRKRSQATLKALKREGRAAASKQALSKHARSVARGKSAAERSGRREKGRSNSREVISRARWAICSAAMGGACALWQLRPPERKRFRAARTAIRQIHAAGEPFHGTVFRDYHREAMRFSRDVTNGSNCISHRAPPKRSCA